ncbi:MAG: hypothetical protein L6R42_005353 [Xanthoria sp. 1 TBL-2021]|nr:MAG: hypothetical protein L6R42_005353 [Xanthoria sp. 1 TBL-2021]
MSADETMTPEKKWKAGPITVDGQFKFLIACIRHGVNGKIDWEEVAKECSIVTKGAAAKRYERLMKAHDISPQAPREASTASPKRQTGKAKETKPTTMKRKAAESDAAEDNEAPASGTKKKFKKNPMSEEMVIKSEEDKEESSGGSSPPQLDGPSDGAVDIDYGRTDFTSTGRQTKVLPFEIENLSSLDKFLEFQRRTPSSYFRPQEDVNLVD